MLETSIEVTQLGLCHSLDRSSFNFYSE